jgi:Fe2+ transport system protein FeoA
MVLSQIKNGKVKIIRFLGGKNFLRKMNALGIFIGDIVEIIANAGHGPVIIGKGSLRIAIGFGMASKIVVEEIKNEESSNSR